MLRRALLRVDLLAVVALVLVSVVPAQRLGLPRFGHAPALCPAGGTGDAELGPPVPDRCGSHCTPAKLSCVRTNCAPAGKAFHSYWAMDLLSPDNSIGAPVYAAGAGVFHVGAVDPTCRSSVDDTGGTWVWIDHGGGKVSRYHHLDSVLAKDGELVTPATVIGTMGHSGDVAPCTTNYLHFEVRIDGVKGDRVDPGELNACVDGAKVQWPRAFGVTSWDSLEPDRLITPTSTSDCITGTWAGTPPRPAPVTGRRAWQRVRITWPGVPIGVNKIVVALETYHPSVPGWGAPVYRTLAASTTTQLYTGLENGRHYRMRVAYHNAAGSSAWSDYVNETPAGRPSTPRAPRWLLGATNSVRFAWWKSTEHGTPTTSGPTPRAGPRRTTPAASAAAASRSTSTSSAT